MKPWPIPTLFFVSMLALTMLCSSEELGDEDAARLLVLSCSGKDSDYMETFYLIKNHPEKWGNTHWDCHDDWSDAYYYRECLTATGDLKRVTRISRYTLDFSTTTSGTGIVYGPLEDEVMTGKCVASEVKKF